MDTASTSSGSGPFALFSGELQVALFSGEFKTRFLRARFCDYHGMGPFLEITWTSVFALSRALPRSFRFGRRTLHRTGGKAASCPFDCEHVGDLRRDHWPTSLMVSSRSLSLFLQLQDIGRPRVHCAKHTVWDRTR